MVEKFKKENGYIVFFVSKNYQIFQRAQKNNICMQKYK